MYSTSNTFRRFMDDLNALEDPRTNELLSMIGRLEDDSNLLDYLKGFGVDNWDGYDDAYAAAEAAKE